jgi:hypothetical protein
VVEDRLKQPLGWEYLVFPQVLQDEIDRCAELKDAYVRGAAFGPRGFDAVVDAFARFPDDVLANVESAGRPLLLRAKDGITRALAGEEVVIDTRLDFQLSHRPESTAALERLR